jgi:predicted permease
MLALLGAGAGLLLAYAGLRGFLALAPSDIPRLDELGLDARVLGLALLASFGVGIAFGCVPVMQARRVDLIQTLKGDATSVSGGRSRRRMRELLVLVELALSVTLAVSAGLLIRSFESVMDVDPGFEAQAVVKAEYQLPGARYPRDMSKYPHWVEIHRFNAALLDRARTIPGVESVALASAHPLDAGFTNSFTVVGREAESGDWPEISVRQVSPGYFPTLGVKLVDGRTLEESDDAAAPLVAVINQEAARLFFESRDPIGQQIRWWGTVRRIVGVVGNERIHGVTEQAPPAVYAPLAQAPAGVGVLFAKTSSEPGLLGPQLRDAIAETDAQLAVYAVEPLSDTVVQSVGERRFAMMVLGAFGLVTIILALVGVHGVVSYTTAQRTREIGIRVALGASRQSVVAMVVRGGLAVAALGTLAGLAGAVAVSRLLSGLLFGVAQIDPLTFLLVPVGVLLATALSAYLPARRAAGIAPVSAIRTE